MKFRSSRSGAAKPPRDHLKDAHGLAASGVPRELETLGTVPTGERACIWMRAGVVKYRLCEQGFDCEHCLLDAALRGQGSEAAWISRDWGPSGYRLFPQELRFSPTHVWVKSLAPSSVRVGLDALAAWLVGDVAGVRLPEAGRAVERGQPLATLVAQGGEISIPAPFDGRVEARNELLLGCPELVTAAPYGAGWLLDVERMPAEGDARGASPVLLSGADAESLSRGQLHEFHRRIDTLLASRSPSVGATLADGGQRLSDPRAMLGSALYLQLVQEMLA